MLHSSAHVPISCLRENAWVQAGNSPHTSIISLCSRRTLGCRLETVHIHLSFPFAQGECLFAGWKQSAYIYHFPLLKENAWVQAGSSPHTSIISLCSRRTPGCRLETVRIHLSFPSGPVISQRTSQREAVVVFVSWLLNVQETCQSISGTDLLRQLCVLPH